MITTSELHRIAHAGGLGFDQAEKDYVILEILHGLSVLQGVTLDWVFKSGTCLRHCYYSGYRFSEDIDFSCSCTVDNKEFAERVLNEVAKSVGARSGLEITIKEFLVAPGGFQIEAPLQYIRSGSRRQALPTVKIHLTFDEPLLSPPEIREVRSPYGGIPMFTLQACSKREIIAEKMRALLQQQAKWPRPRDLYDLWYILCFQHEEYPREQLRTLFEKKCQVRNITPDYTGLASARLKEWNRNAWEIQLAPMLGSPPPYESVWGDWTQVVKILT